MLGWDSQLYSDFVHLVFVWSIQEVIRGGPWGA